MNSRYLAYCAAHERTPEQMLEHDTERWPGGCMAGYIGWVQEQWRVWRKANGYGPNYVMGAQDHARFDAWLGTQWVISCADHPPA